MFTLAHLSDVHLAPLPPVSWRDLRGKRVIGYLNWQRKRRFIHDPIVLKRIVDDLKSSEPHHIVATGDLANIGLNAEYEHARDWLSRLGSPHDVTAIPGNHDAYVVGALEAMQRTCIDFMRGDGGHSEFPFIRRRGPVALIALSTGVPMPPLVAAGELGGSQLERLRNALEQAERDDLFRVVVLHHPPIKTGPRHKSLLDRAAFQTVIAERGAELILHGHDHVASTAWLNGPSGTRVPVIGVPSASAILRRGKDAGGYNLYRIGGSPGAWQCRMERRQLSETGDVVLKEEAVLCG